jgi:peptidoglycan/LPS O-acetylase OafA/YrhL
MGLLVWMALMLDFRWRVALAGLLACGLALSALPGEGAARPASAWIRLNQLGAQRSFALFLVHFPVLILANKAMTLTLNDAPNEAWLAAGLLLVASIGAWGLADLFYRWVELPWQRGWGRPSGQ